MTAYPSTLSFAKGEAVVVNGRLGTIVETIDLNTVQVSDYETGRLEQVAISEVKPCADVKNAAPVLDSVKGKRLRLAEKRYEAIKPLLLLPDRTSKMVAARAVEVGFHPATLYKWIARYEASKQMTSLAPAIRSDKGKSQLPEETEQIISQVIESEYLTRQKKSPAFICTEVRRRCAEAGMKPPHDNTVRNRLKQIPDYIRSAKRDGAQKAANKYSAIRGEFPGADYPMAVVQIDHTKLDIILVDDLHRLPVGRPWITLAMDVYSRMVTGFYISFDPPSASTVGLCLAHSFLPKEKWLGKMELSGEWPCYGPPHTIHADNAKEFRGEMLQLVCKQYGIDLVWRPVARPEYGAHVERLLGTLSKQIHLLSGTTFSDVQQRGKYDSEGKANLTLKEFESWLSTLIVQRYHQDYHENLNMAPIEKYKRGVLGDGEAPGIGLLPRFTDEDRLRIDLLPFLDRTVQRYGIAVDKVQYMHDVLRPWIDARDPEHPKLRRKFIVRRDPRDISKVWFFDPQLQEYFEIPYRNTSHPPISVWELREARKKLVAEGRQSIDEEQLFRALTRMREIEAEAEGKTKAARRAQQRRKMGIEFSSEKKSKTPQASQPEQLSDDDPKHDDLQPFEEMEEL